MSPSLADDEAQFAHLSQLLLRDILDAAPGWVRRCLLECGVDDEVLCATAVSGWFDDVGTELTQLLADDVDAQRINPLAVLRRGVKHPTKALRSAGIEPIVRDRFEVDAFPDDVYGLSPASFGDFAEDLAELGLIWGAAKAHVHLRRRRELT